MLTYKKRNTFLQGLHPLTGLLLIILYLAAFIEINNPVYLIVILISLFTLSIMDGCFKELLQYGEIIFPFAFIIIILNPLIVRNGNTVLYQGHINFPIMGPVRITLEAILYGLFSGLRVIAITIVFGFFNLVVHPDRTFGFFSKYFKKSSLLMSMTIRLFPSMMKSFSSISEVEKLRGNVISDKSLRKKIKSSSNIVNILFLSSLEDAQDMAEAMYARGYGIGRRSTYFHERFTKWDWIIVAIIAGIFAFFRMFKIRGLNKMNFYPLVDNPFINTSIIGIVLCLLFFIPAVINWGWKRWI